MACSDNVVRAGLTPKLIDVSTLCEMLSYKMEKVQLLEKHQKDTFCSTFTPPVEEFKLTCIQLRNENDTYTFQPDEHCIIFVFSGKPTIIVGNTHHVVQDDLVFFSIKNIKITFAGSGEIYICSKSSSHSNL